MFLYIVLKIANLLITGTEGHHQNEQQREIFERLFDRWYQESDAFLKRHKPPPEAVPTTLGTEAAHPSSKRLPSEPPVEPQPPPRPSEKHRYPPETRWFRVVIAVVVVIFSGWQLYDWLHPPAVITPPVIPEGPQESSPPPSSPPPPSPHELPTEPVATFHTWVVPEFHIVQPPLTESGWLLGILGIAAGIFLFQRYRRRARLPKPAPQPQPGPDWLPWLALESKGPELLHPDELRMLVWGIGRFVAEEPTPQMDIGKTVTVTARAGGIPEIHYQPAVYQREVWLWQDALTQDPLLQRLVEELESSLRRAGLLVRTGWFTDLPGQVVWEEGQTFSTLILEGHRQSALVAVLTDGRGLRIAAQDDLDRRSLARLLNGLSQWPHLAFVDVGRGQYGLAELLRPYDLDCIAPEDLPAFLGAGEVAVTHRRKTADRLLGDLRAWAAATALAPQPLDDSEALALRQVLGLELPPWTVGDLLKAGDGLGDRLAWSPRRRAELLNWLVQAEQQDTRVAYRSLLGKALDFWRARLRQERARRQQRQNALEPWQATLAEQRLLMERALLVLWQKPRWATAILYRLYGGSLQEEIHTRLGKLAAWEWHGSGSEKSELVFLPWQWAKQTDKTRYLLGRMGFGREIQSFAGKLHIPSTLSLAAGLCGGLGVLALGISVWNWWKHDKPMLQPTAAVFEHKVFKELAIQASSLSGLNQYTVVVGTPRSLVVAKSVPGGSEIPITWRWAEQPNPLKFGQSELWRAGTLPQVIRGCEPNWPRRSLVVIAADPADKAARKLAIQLLDRGSADAVLLGQDWAEHYRKELIQVDAGFTRQEQLLVAVPSGSPLPERPTDFQGRYTTVSAKNLETLAKALDFNGVKPLPEVWQKQVEKVVNGQQGGVLLRGGPAEEEDPASRISFVRVCGGTFTMGSDKADASAFYDEKPSHQVTLSPFEISKYEITNAQYRRFWKDHQFNDDRPVVNVKWDDARAFCEHYGYSLPTEAQWEYAARAGTTTRWSFGDDEKQLGQYAWFGEGGSIGYLAEPVGRKLPNPLGLYDMHGNAWEWVADCYDAEAYGKRGELTVDPLEGSCGSRLLRGLRGGTFWLEPWYLRSASRARSEPESWVGGIGFRCGRGPRRQP